MAAMGLHYSFDALTGVGIPVTLHTPYTLEPQKLGDVT